MKRLYRDKDNEMIAGVCSGIAEYLDVDPTVIRLVFVLFALMGGGGLWIYLVLWIIMPEEPVTLPEVVEILEKPKETAKAAEETPKTPEKKAAEKSLSKKPAAKAKTSTKKSTTQSSTPSAKKSSTASKPADKAEAKAEDQKE